MSSLNAERARDLLSGASSVLLHSGNVASWNKLRRKGVLTPTDEVTTELASWLNCRGCGISMLVLYAADFYHRCLLHQWAGEAE